MDGATRLEIFHYVIVPQIAPVSLTLILIRMIEAFKLIDIPRILTGGGPGTATETLTLHAYRVAITEPWRISSHQLSAAHPRNLHRHNVLNGRARKNC